MSSVQSLGARFECILHAVASFGANISIFAKMEVLMDLNVVMTSLMLGAALLRGSGDGSEIRRGNTWRLSSRNPRARATEGSNPSLRISCTTVDQNVRHVRRPAHIPCCLPTKFLQEEYA